MSTDQCPWCRHSENGELMGVIGIRVGGFLVGLAGGLVRGKWVSEVHLLYRWGSWKTSESESAAIRLQQQGDFSIEVDLEDNDNDNDNDTQRSPTICR